MLPRTYMGCEKLQGPVWSWTAETSAHTLRLIINGVFDRYPKSKLVLGHMGETLPYMLWRLDRRMQAFAAPDIEPIVPSKILKRNVAVTSAGVFSTEPLTCAVDALGEDSIMYSVDYPFESMEDASAWLNAAAIPEGLKEKISFRNADALLKL